MNNRLSVIFKRYLLPVIIAIVGLGVLIYGLISQQDALFIIAAINLLIGGFLAILFSAGVLSKNIVLGIGFVCIVATIGVGYASVQSVQKTIQHKKDLKRSTMLNIFVLNEIRDVQRAYKIKYGVYASDFEELKEFFQKDKIKKVNTLGSVPTRKLTIEERDALYTDNRALDKNMTEREAALLVELRDSLGIDLGPGLAKFKRDTVLVSFKKEFLNNSTRISQRKQLKMGPFNITELKYIPMTDPKEKWIYETRDAVPYLNSDTIATIHVYGKSAIPQFEEGQRNIIGFGDLNTNSDKGNWE